MPGSTALVDFSGHEEASVNHSTESARSFIDRTRCMAPRNGEEFGGSRCQESATHSTYLGRRCAHHAEAIRRAMRNSNTLANVLNGKRARTEEEITRLVKELPKGEQPS